MRKLFVQFILVCFSSICFGQSEIKSSRVDEVKLDSIAILWKECWNKHDMDAMGDLLDNQVDFVNVAGEWLKGRSETVSDHKKKHLGITFRNSIWVTDSVAVRFIKSDLAIMHVSWKISGDNDLDGTPRKPRQGIFTWLVMKENSKWKIIAAQNTNKKAAIL